MMCSWQRREKSKDEALEWYKANTDKNTNDGERSKQVKQLEAVM
jgi:hypothetical protein